MPPPRPERLNRVPLLPLAALVLASLSPAQGEVKEAVRRLESALERLDPAEAGRTSVQRPGTESTEVALLRSELERERARSTDLARQVEHLTKRLADNEERVRAMGAAGEALRSDLETRNVRIGKAEAALAAANESAATAKDEAARAIKDRDAAHERRRAAEESAAQIAAHLRDTLQQVQQAETRAREATQQRDSSTKAIETKLEAAARSHQGEVDKLQAVVAQLRDEIASANARAELSVKAAAAASEQLAAGQRAEREALDRAARAEKERLDAEARAADLAEVSLRAAAAERDVLALRHELASAARELAEAVSEAQQVRQLADQVRETRGAAPAAQDVASGTVQILNQGPGHVIVHVHGGATPPAPARGPDPQPGRASAREPGRDEPAEAGPAKSSTRGKVD
jgi:chromosome segregation ATPase